MTLGKKLVTSFLACGLLPLGVVAFVSYRTAGSGMGNIEQKGADDLEKKAYNQTGCAARYQEGPDRDLLPGA